MKKRKKTENVFSKGFALFIPSIVSICTFVFVFAKSVFRKEYIKLLSHCIGENSISIEGIANQLYNMLEEDKSTSFELIIGIIGVAVSVWIGLSIYNSIEKKDVEDAIDNIDSTLKEIEKKHRILYLTTMLNNRAEDSHTQYYLDSIQRKLPSLSVETINTLIEMETLLSTYDGNFSSSENDVAKDKLDKVRAKYALLKQELFQGGGDKTLLSYYHFKLGGVCCRIADNLYRNNEKKSLSKRYFCDAIKEYEEAGRLDPILLSVDNGIGFSYLRLSQLYNNNQELCEKAIQYLELACETNPLFQKAIRNLGVAYEVCNKLDKAIEQYKKAEKLFPDSYLVHSCLASAYLKKVDERVRFFSRTKTFDKAFFCLNDKEKNALFFYLKQAKWHARFVVELMPCKIDGYYRLIEYYTFLIMITKKPDCFYKKHERAVERLKQFCIMIDDSNNAYRCHLRNYYEVIGEIDKAKEINDSLNNGKMDIY